MLIYLRRAGLKRVDRGSLRSRFLPVLVKVFINTELTRHWVKLAQYCVKLTQYCVKLTQYCVKLTHYCVKLTHSG